MEAVVNNANIKKFPILGVSQGCGVSIAYAIRNPEKVSHLILFGGFARGKGQRNDPSYDVKSKMEQTMILSGWEDENPAFRQFFATSMIPEGTKEQMDSFNNIMKVTTSAKNAARISMVNDQINVTEMLSKLEIPTIIFHCTEDARVPFSEGKFLAANIKNSKFIPINSKNHILLENEEGWNVFKKEVSNFLKN
jgi:pimeloyl-ACP methyl ester carboxylesterase